MNTMARLPQSTTSRSIGIGFVIAIHVVAFIGLSNGLMHNLMPKPSVLETRILKTDPLPPPEPIIKVKVDPILPVPDPVLVPTPEVPIDYPVVSDKIRAVPIGDSHPVISGVGTGGMQIGLTVAPIRDTGPLQASAVCTRMSPPSVPTTSWSGEALFRATVSTHAGRVTGVEIQSLRGGMDSRTLRAFRSSIESALRDGYECPGDVRFTQEFNFRVD
ncbi:MAG TPA: hypothetical protein VGE47_10710 [Burkholderiaceae bacterium]